jgi:hypothetical protein
LGLNLLKEREITLPNVPKLFGYRVSCPCGSWYDMLDCGRRDLLWNTQDRLFAILAKPADERVFDALCLRIHFEAFDRRNPPGE